MDPRLIRLRREHFVWFDVLEFIVEDIGQAFRHQSVDNIEPSLRLVKRIF